MFGMIYNCAGGVLGTTMNLWMIVTLISRRKTAQVKKIDDDTKEREIKLVIYSLCIFFGFMMNFGLQVTI